MRPIKYLWSNSDKATATVLVPEGEPLEQFKGIVYLEVILHLSRWEASASTHEKFSWSSLQTFCKTSTSKVTTRCLDTQQRNSKSYSTESEDKNFDKYLQENDVMFDL